MRRGLYNEEIQIPEISQFTYITTSEPLTPIHPNPKGSSLCRLHPPAIQAKNMNLIFYLISIIMVHCSWIRYLSDAERWYITKMRTASNCMLDLSKSDF